VISSRSHPTLSIVMPSYNQARFLRRAIESVLVHTEVDLELLVFDGGSTDGSVEILESIDDPRLRFVSRRDRGQADAINQGFAMARGEIMAWLNSDDEYVPGALAFVIEHFRNDPDCLALYGDVDMVDESGRVLRRYPTKAWTSERMARKCHISQPSVFVRREVVETAGPLMLQLMLCLDYEYWHRIARDCPWQTVDRVLAHTRIYAETKTSSRRMRGIVEGCCVSRYYHGRLPLRWSVKYMCRRARLQPQRYLLTPAGWVRWLSIPMALSRRCCPDRTRSGWIRRLYEALDEAPRRMWDASVDRTSVPSGRTGLARPRLQVDETRA
jgi:glycosyltransferase involved in cell wall biosynthesis